MTHKEHALTLNLIIYWLRCRGLGMSQRDPIVEKIPGFAKASVKMKILQAKFLTQLRNDLVRGLQHC